MKRPPDSEFATAGTLIRKVGAWASNKTCGWDDPLACLRRRCEDSHQSLTDPHVIPKSVSCPTVSRCSLHHRHFLHTSDAMTNDNRTLYFFPAFQFRTSSGSSEGCGIKTVLPSLASLTSFVPALATTRKSPCRSLVASLLSSCICDTSAAFSGSEGWDCWTALS